MSHNLNLSIKYLDSSLYLTHSCIIIDNITMLVTQPNCYNKLGLNLCMVLKVMCLFKGMCINRLCNLQTPMY